MDDTAAAMTHFSRQSFRFAFGPPVHSPARPAVARDVLWGRPVFHAPTLNPRTQFDPLPFTAVRVTRRGGRD
jgi:hypothetical protein